MNKEKILAALNDESKLVTYLGWTVCKYHTNNEILAVEDEHGFYGEWEKVDLTRIKIYQEIVD